MIILLAACLLCCVPGSRSLRLTVHTASGTPVSVERLTSVTIDVCALKQNLSFTDPMLIALTKHLSPAVLRIGGTDQNNFNYSMQRSQNFVTCYDKAGRVAPLGCHQQRTLASAYWDSIHKFLERTGLKLLFGLSPSDADNAISLISHTALRKNYSSNMFGYSFGNEQIGKGDLVDAYFDKITLIRKALTREYSREDQTTSTPLLVAPDTGLGPRQLWISRTDL